MHKSALEVLCALTLGLPIGIWLTLLGYELPGLLVMLSGWTAFLLLVFIVHQGLLVAVRRLLHDASSTPTSTSFQRQETHEY